MWEVLLLILPALPLALGLNLFNVGPSSAIAFVILCRTPTWSGARTSRNVAFEEAYVSEIAEVGAVPIAGAEDIFKYLRSRGVAVALTTGFSRSTLDTLLIELGWKDLIDLSITPSEAGRGRPHPDMLNMAVEVLGITKPEHVIVLGDTASDMQAAVAFGAGQAIGVLTGAHDEHRLHDAGATSVINSVADLKSLI